MHKCTKEFKMFILINHVSVRVREVYLRVKMAPKAQNREIKDETPNDLGNNPSADPHQKEQNPHGIAQKELIVALKDQFVANRHLLRCPKCQSQQVGQMTNNGKGGGPLQHNSYSIQLSCKICNRKSRPDNTYEYSGLPEEVEKYKQILTKSQTKMANIATNEKKNKPMQ